MSSHIKTLQNWVEKAWVYWQLMCFFIVYFWCILSAAQIPSELLKVVWQGDTFGRSSAQFIGRSNVTRVITKGSEAEVLEIKKMPSGNYGLRIKILSAGESKGPLTAKIAEEMWVYLDTQKPWLELYNSDQQKITDLKNLQEHSQPVNTAKALEDNYGLLQVPNTGGVTPVCDHCSTATPQKNNLQDISQLFQTTAETNLQSLPAEPSVNPIPTQPNQTTMLWSDQPDIINYENHPDVQNMIDSALKNSGSPRSRCYRYVKHALCHPHKQVPYANPQCSSQGLIEQYSQPETGSVLAVNAMLDLPKQGFKNILSDPNLRQRIRGPQDAPKGSILVYRHKKNSCSFRQNSNRNCEAGHIEIKTDFGSNSMYVSDHAKPHPVLGNIFAGRASQRYELIGVFYKPNLGKNL